MTVKIPKYDLMMMALRAQDECNTLISGPDWRKLQRPWHRPIWVEAGEALGYINWEWWVNVSHGMFRSDHHRQQFYLELADILAFGLSLSLDDSTLDEVDEVCLNLAKVWESSEGRVSDLEISAESLTQAMEHVVESALGWCAFDAGKLFEAAAISGLGVEGLLAYYLAKDTLNKFRQENGYKEGKYLKNWGTKEHPEQDNVELASIVERFRDIGKGDPAAQAQRILSGNFTTYVRSALSLKYSEVKERNGR